MSQYRSALYFHTDAQEQAIEKSIALLPNSKSAITTEIRRIDDGVKYWQAEDYHQQYLQKGGQQHTTHSAVY
jgi:peptide-methionine (S)-S-oxide reductase